MEWLNLYLRYKCIFSNFMFQSLSFIVSKTFIRIIKYRDIKYKRYPASLMNKIIILFALCHLYFRNLSLVLWMILNETIALQLTFIRADVYNVSIYRRNHSVSHKILMVYRRRRKEALSWIINNLLMLLKINRFYIEEQIKNYFEE